MTVDPQEFRDGAGIAAFSIAQRLLGLLADNPIPNAEIIKMLGEEASNNGKGGPANQVAAQLLQQLQVYHQKKGGMVSN